MAILVTHGEFMKGRTPAGPIGRAANIGIKARCGLDGVLVMMEKPRARATIWPGVAGLATDVRTAVALSRWSRKWKAVTLLVAGVAICLLTIVAGVIEEMSLTFEAAIRMAIAALLVTGVLSFVPICIANGMREPGAARAVPGETAIAGVVGAAGGGGAKVLLPLLLLL